MARPQKKNFQKKEPKEFEEEVIQVDRVTRVVKGGRRLRFRATVVIGDKNGRVGYGIGKSVEVQAAIQKAVSKAKQRLIEVPIYNGTIPHTVQTKYKAAVVMLKPAGKGTGIIAGGAVRKILDLAGVKNVLSKSLGSNNRLNTTKAAYEALTKLRLRPELETDIEKTKKIPEDKGAPTVKKISRKEAKDMAEAGKKRVNVKKEKKEKEETTSKTDKE